MRSCICSKIEERKKLLEPQVLRIADDDDLLENDLEVDDSDDDYSDERQSNYFQQGLYSIRQWNLVFTRD